MSESASKTHRNPYVIKGTYVGMGYMKKKNIVENISTLDMFVF